MTTIILIVILWQSPLVVIFWCDIIPSEFLLRKLEIFLLIVKVITFIIRTKEWANECHIKKLNTWMERFINSCHFDDISNCPKAIVIIICIQWGHEMYIILWEFVGETCSNPHISNTLKAIRYQTYFNKHIIINSQDKLMSDWTFMNTLRNVDVDIYTHKYVCMNIWYNTSN